MFILFYFIFLTYFMVSKLIIIYIFEKFIFKAKEKMNQKKKKKKKANLTSRGMSIFPLL